MGLYGLEPYSTPKILTINNLNAMKKQSTSSQSPETFIFSNTVLFVIASVTGIAYLILNIAQFFK